MKLLLGADLVPTKSNEELFRNGDVEALVGEQLIQILRDADYRIFNLELPLTDQASPIEKYGPALIAPTDTVAGYRALGVDLLTLANNHILDQGVQGLESTCRTLKKAEIPYLGVGDTPEEAAKPYILQGDRKVGIYACAEHEFSIVDEKNPGANPFDPLESLDHVAQLKQQCDCVIVLYHGGKEHYRYPSPQLQKVCRKLVEKGADLVICQHSHCIGCEEKYQNGTIVYGQGNFLFDLSQSEYWQTSLLIRLEEDLTVTYLPLVKTGNGVRLAEGAEGEKILKDFRERSEQIREPGVIAEKYAAFAKEYQDFYLLSLGGFNIRNFFFRVVNRLTGDRLGKWIIKCRYSRKKRLGVYNHLKCEAHRELLLQGLIKD